MANDFACKIAGIGSINLMTYDGKLYTLTEIRHVSLMSKNLISISLSESRGVPNVYRKYNNLKKKTTFICC